MKNWTADVVVKKFVGWKSKIYSFWIDHSSDHKKAKNVNKNIVATISHNELFETFYQ